MYSYLGLCLRSVFLGKVVKSQTGPLAEFMSSKVFRSSHQRFSDQIQATKITGIFSGDRPESENLLEFNANLINGCRTRAVSGQIRAKQIRTPEHKLLLGGRVSHLENIREDQIGT